MFYSSLHREVSSVEDGQDVGLFVELLVPDGDIWDLKAFEVRWCFPSRLGNDYWPNAGTFSLLMFVYATQHFNQTSFFALSCLGHK